MTVAVEQVQHSAKTSGVTAVRVLAAISVSHLLNDTIQSLIPSIYPILKASFQLNYSQVGLIALTLQLTASLLQPVVGMYTDRRPMPNSLVGGMAFSLVGLMLLSIAGTLGTILVAAGLVGVGSSIFHPESSRVARMASGGRHGLAQSVFQVGGNLGSSLGPLLAAFVVIPWGQSSIAWFSAAALLAMTVLFAVGNWYRRERAAPPRAAGRYMAELPRLSRRRIGWSIVILLAVIFSKAFYTTSLNSYYTFYLISKFDVSIESAQIYLFAFLASVALGTLIGGPVGDRIGRKAVIWVSIVGVLPFTLVLPYADLFWTGILTVVIGMTLASASSAIIVYALELVPGRIGMVAGLFFGLSFGMAGIGAAVLGRVADGTSIDTVYQLCAFLPAIGLLTALLPNLGRPVPPTAKTSPQST